MHGRGKAKIQKVMMTKKMIRRHFIIPSDEHQKSPQLRAFFKGASAVFDLHQFYKQTEHPQFTDKNVILAL